MKHATKRLIFLSSALLIATAVVHYLATDMVQSALATVDISPFLKQALPTLWLVFSWHLIVIAVLLLLSSYLPSRPKRLAYWLFVMVVSVDFCWVFSVAGWFSGTFLLIAAAILLFVSSVMQKLN